MYDKEYKLLPVSPSFFGAKQTPVTFPKCYRPFFISIKVQLQLLQFSTLLSFPTVLIFHQICSRLVTFMALIYAAEQV
jgi:hypothetical protein